MRNLLAWIVAVLVGACSSPQETSASESAAPDRAAEQAPATLQSWARSQVREVAYSMTMQSAPFGWITEKSRIEERDRGPCFVRTVESQTRASSLGEDTESFSRTVEIYSLDGEGPLVEFVEQLVEDGEQQQKWLLIEGDRWRVRREGRDGPIEREGPLSDLGPTLASMREQWTWLQGSPKSGERSRLPILGLFDPELFTEIVTVYEGSLGDQGPMQHRVTIIEDGLESEAILDADGVPLEGSLAGRFGLVRTDEASAKAFPSERADFDRLTHLEVDVDLGDGEELERLVIELSGLGSATLPESEHQAILIAGAGRVVLETTRRARLPAAELSPEERARYLACDHRVRCDEARLRRAAAEIAVEHEDLRERIGALMEAIDDLLEDTTAANASDALTILDNGSGDCTEHALLFVAFARAVGLPARELGGVVWGGPGSGIFAWHAWAEVHDGERWLAVDPAYRQFPADVTHLATTRDAGTQNAGGVILTLALRVVEFE